MPCKTCNATMSVPKGAHGPQCLTCRPVRAGRRIHGTEPRHNGRAMTGHIDPLPPVLRYLERDRPGYAVGL